MWIPRSSRTTGQSVLEEGPRVPAGTSQRIACDSSKVVMQHRTDGEPQFYSPFGVRLPNVPEPPELPNDPVSALIDRHREEGLAIGAQTTRPNRDGEPVDVGYVVDVLRSP